MIRSVLSSETSAGAPAATRGRSPGILHLACATGKQSAGVQRHVAGLANGLHVRGYPVWVWSPAQSWLHRQLDAGILNVPCAGWPVLQSQALVRRIAREDIRIVHAHNRAGMKMALDLRKATGCTVVATAHTMTPYPEFQEADFRISVSEAVAERYLHYSRGAVASTVIYCGVDAEQFCPQDGARAAVRAELGFAPDTPLIFTAARLAKRSNVDCLMGAAERVLKVRPDARFLVAGSGPLLCRMGARLGLARHGLGDRFRLLGERTDLPRLFSAADVFVLCSRQEALGLALLEAMACRVPVVGSRVGGIVETMEDGLSGLLARPEPADVAAKILDLLSDDGLRSGMGRAARARVCERFSLAKTLERHEELYQSAA